MDAQLQGRLLNDLGVGFARNRPSRKVRYVLFNAGTVNAGFSGEYDAETEAQIESLRWRQTRRGGQRARPRHARQGCRAGCDAGRRSVLAGDLDEVAAGVVEDGGGHRPHVHRLLHEVDTRRPEAFELRVRVFHRE